MLDIEQKISNCESVPETINPKPVQSQELTHLNYARG